MISTTTSLCLSAKFYYKFFLEDEEFQLEVDGDSDFQKFKRVLLLGSNEQLPHIAEQVLQLVGLSMFNQEKFEEIENTHEAKLEKLP